MVLKETLLSGEARKEGIHDYLREGKVTYFAKSVLGRGRTSQDAQKNISYKTRPAARPTCWANLPSYSNEQIFMCKFMYLGLRSREQAALRKRAATYNA